MSKKILFIIPSFKIGGVENLTINNALELKKRGFHIYIVALDGSNVENKLFYQFEIFNLGLTKNIYFLLSILKLVSIISKLEIKLIHSHTVKANIISRIVKIFFNYRLICSEHHTINSAEKINFFKKIIFRINIKACDLITNVSKEAIDSYKKKMLVKDNEMILFYNGIDLEKYKFNNDLRYKIRKDLNIQDNDFCFFGVGRLSSQKNFMILIQAIESLISNHNVKLFIIGDGPEKLDLQNYISSKKLNKKVFLLGSKNNVHEYYSAFDCFVLSSDFEGLPTVLIEAAASTRLIVATDSGGVKEILSPTYKYIVPPKNLEAMVATLKNIKTLPVEAVTEITESNLVHVKKFFSDKIMYELWFNTYMRFIENE